MQIKLVAVVISGGKRYERDLAQDFMMVPVWNIFPPRNDFGGLIPWADRISHE